MLTVSPVRELIDVVAGLVEEIQQTGLLDTRLRPRDDLRLVGKDAIPEEGRRFEAGGFDLFEIRLVVGIRQTEADQAGEIFFEWLVPIVRGHGSASKATPVLGFTKIGRVLK